MPFCHNAKWRVYLSRAVATTGRGLSAFVVHLIHFSTRCVALHARDDCHRDAERAEGGEPCGLRTQIYVNGCAALPRGRPAVGTSFAPCWALGCQAPS